MSGIKRNIIGNTMQQKARHILSMILIAAMLTAGTYIFRPEDASRDSRIDLQDAILQVKKFVRTADEPATFTASVERVISTLNVVAGLKTVIRQAEPANSFSKSTAYNDFYLTSLCDYPILPDHSSRICEQSFIYESLFVDPGFRGG
jgi:hypothetical protein